MDWLEVTIPSPSAAIIRDALSNAIADGFENPHEAKIALDLREFFAFAVENPRAFPPSSMAPALKARAKAHHSAKTDTPSRKRRRHTRHQARLAAHKQRRNTRAESVAAHNAAFHDELHVEGDGSGPRPLWKRLIPGGGAGGHEVEGPSTHDEG